ncbi:uncharacterized protein LOC105175347 [Sesamum indicum]|uniref:Uncharacterized protein LOC105175347 n=1 Tax=Sesamum indicum TaxID=4182 RepID=A0A6I9U5R8_SESIN|nr:uncharacterized protein LOC105175347 [Sesamum indicum]XP_020553884.1 uncharacterized protein LOC105175347 [Sesamum indicum]
MGTDEQAPALGWIRSRRNGIGGRRTRVGTELAATPFVQWKLRGGDSAAQAAVSARKLAASLWRVSAANSGGGSVRWQCGPFDRLRFEFFTSVPIPKIATEGVTKWDYCYSKAWVDVSYFRDCAEILKNNQDIATTPVASARCAELFKARKRINELEAEQGWSRTKLKHFLKKLNEERASWIRTQHQKMCSMVKNLENDVKRERRKCRKMDIMNSKLLNDITEVKLSARKFKQNFEKEKRARELWEDVCDELAKEIEGSKAEIEVLRNQHARIQEEVEKERKMLQLVEVWREERSQMKLINAKFMSEHKYAKMNNLIVDLEAFLRPLNSTTDMVKEFSSEIEDSQTCEAEVIRITDNCFSHNQANYETFDATRKSVCSNGLTGGGSGFEDASCQETLTQAEIYTTRISGGSDHSVNKISRSKYTSNYDAEHKENAHHGYERSESNEISSSVSLKQSKKKKSSTLSKLQRTLPRNEDTCKTILTDGISRRPSNGSISSIAPMASPQGVCSERVVDGQDFVGQWRSHDQQRNPHVVRAMKGHIEWRRGIPRQGSAANLLKAKLESQKMILRNVLKRRS